MWKWEKKNPRVLASLVNFAQNSEVLDNFKDQLLDDEGRQINLQVLQDEKKDYELLIKAIDKALANKNISYSFEKYDSSEEHQLIREPDEIISSERLGTCLDLAVLFCGMCWRYELIPLLIKSKDHAWVAVSRMHRIHDCQSSARNNEIFIEGLLTEQNKIADLQKLVEEGEYIAIEATGFTQGSYKKSFDDAVKVGSESLKDLSTTNGGFILDVVIANDYCWRDLAKERLEAEKPNRKSPLGSGKDPIEELYVKLSLIERKPDAKRRPSGNILPYEGSVLNKPDKDEVVKKYEHDEFFDEILKKMKSSPSQGKQRLAIVGDPGAGKTTLLRRIAHWIYEGIFTLLKLLKERGGIGSGLSQPDFFRSK